LAKEGLFDLRTGFGQRRPYTRKHIQIIIK
jgi:hypothetical protein